MKKCLFYAPSQFNPGTSSAVVSAKLFAQFHKATSKSPHGKFWVVSPVPVLLLWICPTAILWTIIAIGILSLQAFTNWLFPHVDQKVRKSFPSYTDTNPFPSVVLITDPFCVSAALDHSDPNPISGRCRLAMSPEFVSSCDAVCESAEIHSIASINVLLAAGDRRQPALAAKG
jgi:hypothetical protein